MVDMNKFSDQILSKHYDLSYLTVNTIWQWAYRQDD